MEPVGWLAALQRDGTAVVGRLGNASLIDEVHAEADDLIDRFRAGDRSAAFWHFDGGAGDILYRVHGLEFGPRDGAVLRLQRDGDLIRVASRALQVDDPMPGVAALIVKEPCRGAGVPWHQDRPFAGNRDAVNITVYLHGSDPQNGCVTFVPGSHLFSSPVDTAKALVQATRAGLVRDLVVADGEVTVHDVRLVHGSGVNPSARPRLAVVYEYTAPGVVFDDSMTG